MTYSVTSAFLHFTREVHTGSLRSLGAKSAAGDTIRIGNMHYVVYEGRLGIQLTSDFLSP